MLLMIDNYDSFTYNIVQYFGELGEEVRTVRNDEISLERDCSHLNPDRICISPGPKSPIDAGVSVDVLKQFKGKKPILGVCLGHQAIGEAFGGKIIRAKQVMHGKTSKIAHIGRRRVQGLAQPLHRDPLPLAGDRARVAACLPGSDGVDGRRRDHGRAPQGIRYRGRAVPSGVDSVGAWACDAEELPRALNKRPRLRLHVVPAEGRDPSFKIRQ
jgi:anthranilate synthase component 2